MNERIKELALEARLGPALMLHYWKNIDALTDSEQAELEQLEKFAELIVRECINIVDEQKECLHEEQQYWHDRDYGYEMAVNDASKGIKQFFGVEEPKGWICSKCGVDRTKSVCPKGDTAALTGECPMVGTAHSGVEE